MVFLDVSYVYNDTINQMISEASRNFRNHSMIFRNIEYSWNVLFIINNTWLEIYFWEIAPAKPGVLYQFFFTFQHTIAINAAAWKLMLSIATDSTVLPNML